ncbi:MAG: PAS domain-containing protein [Candidatus Heimdallarchaeota archaeon]|nr:MAG: PAS domain-containing protein [Candidatus Heimdallarchaeota archaeon]
MELETLLERQDIPNEAKNLIERYIQEVRQNELQLKESEEKYRNLVERANDGMTIIQDRLLKFVNPSLAKIIGYSVDELLNTPFMNYIHSSVRDELVDRYELRISGKTVPSVYESILVKKDCSLVEVEISAGIITFQDKSADLVIVRDITERKRVVEELQESKEKYQMLVEKLQEGVLLEDAEGMISFINPKTAELLGYTENELLGKHWSYIVPEEYIEIITLETEKRPKGVSSTYEACALAKEGHQIPVIITATPIFGKNDEFKGVLSVFTDITNRKETEQKLRKSEERYRSFFENARDIVFTLSNEGMLTSVNPAVEEITGWSQFEWVGKSFLPLVHSDDLPIILEGFQQVISGKRPPTPELRLLTKSGDYVVVEVKAAPQIEDGKVIGMLGFARNITERRLAEKTLRDVKIAEERYFAMMSHFINNNMQKIINNLELLSLLYESKLVLDAQIVSNVVNIASGSSKTINTVNKIFGLLQTPFTQPETSISLLSVINAAISEIPAFSSLYLDIDEEQLDVEIFGDMHLHDAFSEIFSFLLSSDDEGRIETGIEIKGSDDQDYFYVLIADTFSNPLSPEMVTKLSENITDEWEIIGHNIGIALTSVIMNYFGGHLHIFPSKPKGNEFQLRFPTKLISYKEA